MYKLPINGKESNIFSCQKYMSCSTGMTNINKIKDNKYWWTCEKVEPLFIGIATMKIKMNVSQKTEVELLNDPGLPLLVVYQNDSKSCLKTCIYVYCCTIQSKLEMEPA